MKSTFAAKWFKSVFFVAMTAFAAGSFAQDGLPSDAKPLNPPQPVDNDGKIEVIEFFGYGCIHCAHLEPRLHEWAKKLPADVKFVRVPVGVSKGVPSIPIYYTLEAMGQVEKLHQKIFDAVHVENVVLGSPPILNKWLEKQGIDVKKYEEMQKSFSVQGKIRRAEKMISDYRVAATPTITVNGRFSVEQVSGADRLLAALDRVIANERMASKLTPPAAVPATAPKKTSAKKSAEQSAKATAKQVVAAKV